MTDLPSVLLTLQGNLSKSLSPQVKSEKTRSSAGRCVIKTTRTVGLWRNKASQTGAERSVFSFVGGLFKQPLPPFCDWSKPLLYVAKCLCCCTQLGRCHGFWKSPADFRICFSLRTSQLFIGLVWRRRSVFWILPKFCTPYNNQISNFWWELCKKMSCIWCCKNSQDYFLHSWCLLCS